MFFARYGLRINPFGGDLLNPLDCPKHASYYVRVDGFADQKPNIDAWADKPMARTQFFLIYGYTGTGRTSLCNYIADKFRCTYVTQDPRKHRNILRVNINIPNDDHFGALHNWMEKLSLIAKLNRLEFSSEVNHDFEKEVRNQKPPRSVPLYQELLYKALKELSAKNRRLVAIFDNVVNPKIFTLVQDVFDELPLPDIALVILTTKTKNLHQDFGKLNPRPSGLPPITLQGLTGREVLELISERWKQVKAYPPQPFEEQAVVKAFDPVKHPFRRVVRSLEYILNRKIGTLQSGRDWPHDQCLKVNRGEIFEFLYEFENPYPP